MTTGTEHDHLREAARLAVGRISAGLDSQVAPMISQILHIIRDVSGRAESMSVNDLVESISGEPTTMGRIVSIASSVGYNSSGAEICSIHHAISLIGFDRIRTLAISILLLEGAQSASTAEVNRELAGQAFISGLVSAEMCRRGVPADPELAFICGTLRGYARMLAATFMPTEYAAAVKAGGREGQDEAFKAVYGLSPLELGRQVLASLQVPKHILNSFVTLSPQTRRKAAANPTSALICAADFGLRAAELLQARDLRSNNFEMRMEKLSREYDSAFVLSRTASRELLHHVVGVLECFRFRAGSYVGSVGMFRRLECLAAERPLPLPFTVVPEPVVPRARSVPRVEEAGYFDI